MVLYHVYALVLGIVLSLTAVIGAMGRWRSLILASMVFSAISASPVTTFTRGGAGAIFPSDMVAATLLFCMLFNRTKSMFYPITPAWYRKFMWWMVAAAISVLIVAPLLTVSLEWTGFGQRVRIPIPLPLPLLMAGFRIMRIALFWVYFAYVAYLVMDEKTARSTSKMIVLAITILAVCEIVTFLGIANMALYLPGVEYQAGHIIGHAKAAASRLYVAGLFVCVLLLYRSVGAPFYLATMAVMGTALFCSGSRGALVGAAAGLLVFAAKAKLGGKILAVLLVIVAVAAVPYLVALDPDRAEQFAQIAQAPEDNPRWVIWDWTFEHLAAHPWIFITGVGFTNFNYALESQGAVAEHAHNDVLTCVVELGLIGTAFFIAYLFYLGSALLSKLKHSGGQRRWEALCLTAIFAGFLATGLFEQTFYYTPGAMSMQRVLAVLFGVYTAWWAQQRYAASVSEPFLPPRR